MDKQQLDNLSPQQSKVIIEAIKAQQKTNIWNKKKETLEAGSGVRFTHRKTNHIIDVIKDNRSGEYCYYDNTLKEIIKRVSASAMVFDEMSQLGDKDAPLMKKPEFNYLIDDFKFINTPAKPEGNNGNDWNLFKVSPAMRILQGGKLTKPYKHPTATLEMYKNFMPNEQERNYWLGFWRKKLQDFTQSSTVFVLISETHGAGKGFLMSHLDLMMNVNHVKYASFKSNFDEWLDESYIINLNEIGTKCNTDEKKEEFYEKVKELSEPGKMKLVRKGLVEKDVFNLNTFIITTNKDPFLLTQSSDRRLSYYWLPNILLEEAEWIKKYDGSITNSDNDGTDELFEQVEKEIEDFAYYLREYTDDIPLVSSKDYKKPPQNNYIKNKLLNDRPVIETIMEALLNNDYDVLLDLATRKDLPMDEFIDGWELGRISKPSLYRLLNENELDLDLSHKLTDKYGSNKQWTTKTPYNVKVRGYKFDQLKEWVVNNKETYNKYATVKFEIDSECKPTNSNDLNMDDFNELKTEVNPFAGLKF